MATISGTLTDGTGQIINNCTIVLHAKRTTAQVLTQTQAFKIADNGRYSMNVLPCDYDVLLLIDGFPPKKLGSIQVFASSKNGTLNDFLLLPQLGQPITPAILEQIADDRSKAQAAATSAQTSASNAQASVGNVNNALASTLISRKAGGGGNAARYALIAKGVKTDDQDGNITLAVAGTGDFGAYTHQVDIISFSTRGSGNLEILNLRNAQKGGCEYGIQQNGDSYYLWLKTTTYTSGFTVTKISSDSNKSYVDVADTITFQSTEPTNITYKAPIKIIKQGDYGIGKSSLPTLADFNSLTIASGLYLAFGAGTGASATPNCPPTSGNSRLTVTVRCDGLVSHFEVIENTGAGARKYIGQYFKGVSSVMWTEVLRQGDGGILSASKTNNTPASPSVKTGFYKHAGSALDVPAGFGSWGYYIKQSWSEGSAEGDFEANFIYQSLNSPKIAVGYTNKTTKSIVFAEIITSAIATVDSNGVYKKASPILQLYSTDEIDEKDGFTKTGYGLANSEALGVTAKRIGVGHYEVHGSLGFAKEGWYITLPEDANGNKKIFAEYSTDENNVITIKTYTKKFDFEKCEVIAGEPIDITESRWIDVRLEMPVIETVEQIKPIPSVLNAIVTD